MIKDLEAKAMLTKELDRVSSHTEVIEVVPDKSLMQKVGKAGYSLSESIAELVDNSIDSFYKSYKIGRPLKELQVKVEVMPQHGYIQVEDDALGMDYQESKDCFRLGASVKVDDLGVYGIGLKGASMASGSEVTVLTTQAGEAHSYRLQLNIKEWLRDPDWHLQMQFVPKVNRELHGTIVRITNLHRTGYKSPEIERVREDFGKRYAAFLKQKLVTIQVNNVRCQYKPPELLNDERFEFKIHLDSGVLEGWYGFLKRGSQIGQYGFDTFWHKRLITQYDKIGFVPHPTLARLIGEIHMDHVPVQTTKRGWQTESPQYAEAIEELRKFLEKEGVIRRARELSAQAKITRQVKDKVDQYLDSLAKAMTSPEVLALCPQDPLSSGEGTSGRDENPFGPIEQVEKEVERRHPQGGHGKVQPGGDGSRQRIPKETHKVQRVVKVGGKRYKFEHEFKNLGEEGLYKEWVLPQNNQTLYIYTNIDFPAYHTTNDYAFYAADHVAESLAEFISGEEASWTRVNRLKDTILRKAGAIQAQLPAS